MLRKSLDLALLLYASALSISYLLEAMLDPGGNLSSLLLSGPERGKENTDTDESVFSSQLLT